MRKRDLFITSIKYFPRLYNKTEKNKNKIDLV